MSTEVHKPLYITKTMKLDFAIRPLFDEYFNGENKVVLKSSDVTTTDASNKRQQQPDSTSSTSTLATTVTANGNFNFRLGYQGSRAYMVTRVESGCSKTTAWNEFSSTMASAIICLATNQKFNFSKYIFESMIRNLDNVSGKFLMYPRRAGKGFSGRVTPLFLTMVVQNQSELGKGSSIPTDPHHTPTITQSSTQPQKTQKPRKPKRKDTQVPQPSDPIENVADEAVHKELGKSLVRATTTASSLEAEQDSDFPILLRFNSVRTNINTVRSKQPVPTNNTNSFSPVRPQGNWGTAVKTSAGYNWRNSRPNSNCDSGPTFIRTVNAKGPQADQE
ncbi:hypothetical protein Tco_0668240 [Tanacetum coccineum]